MYEPWYIGHVSQTPFYDVRYRGYGEDTGIFIEQSTQAYLLPDGAMVRDMHAHKLKV